MREKQVRQPDRSRVGKDGKMKIINLVEDTAGSGQCGYEHGLSFYVETEKHRLLVDSGATDMFIKNAVLLGVDLTKVDTLILSHGHYDHAGGILAFSRINPDAKIYLRASAGEDYYHLTSRGEKYIGIDKRIPELGQCVRVEGDLKIDEELFLYTNIAGVKFPAKGNLRLKKKVGAAFVQDLMKKPSVFYTGHCTGAAAYKIMKEIMGEKLQPIHSGDEILAGNPAMSKGVIDRVD